LFLHSLKFTVQPAQSGIFTIATMMSFGSVTKNQFGCMLMDQNHCDNECT